MSQDRASAGVSAPWWGGRAAMIATFVLLFLATTFFYAASSWAIVGLHLLTDGLFLVGWLLGAMGIGWLILRAFRIDLARNSLRTVVSIALGLGILSLVVLILGLAGWLNHWTAVVLICAPAVVSIFEVSRMSKSARAGWLREPARWNWLSLLLAPLLGIAMVAALVPPGILWGDEPNGYDVVEYHLQVPREWYEAGRITPLTHNVFSYFPMNVEMHYLLAMHLRGGPWAGMYLAQLMHVAFIALTIFAIYALLADRGAIAIIACVFAGAIPWMSLLAPIAFNEGGLLLWGTLAIGVILKKGNITDFLFAGAMAGFACGAKLTAGPLILLAVPVAFALAKPQAAEVKRLIGRCALFVVAGLVTFSPWLIRNIAWTGNPVFPEETRMFGKGHFSDAQIERWKRANHLPAADKQSPVGRASELGNQIIGDRRYAFAVIPLAMIAAMIARKSFDARALIVLLILQLLFWLFLTHLQSRFFVLSIPICALLVGAVDLKWWPTLAAICAVLICAQTLVVMDKRIEKYLLPGILGAENLTALTPLADERLPESTHVVLVGDAKAFWYQIPMTRLRYRSVFDVGVRPGESSVDAWRRGAPSGADVVTVIDPIELKRFSNTYWMIPQPPAEVVAHTRPYIEH